MGSPNETMGLESAQPRLSPEQLAVAMKDPGHLKQWLEASGRRYMVFPAMELVDALPWPGGHEALLQIIAAFRDHRRVMETGRYAFEEHPVTHEKVKVPVYKSELLEPEEVDRAIRYLVERMLEHDPSWSLEKPAL